MPLAARNTVTNEQDRELRPETTRNKNNNVTDGRIDLTTRESTDVSDVTDRQRESLEAESLREEFEERAAILEFDGGLSRDEAENAARTLVSGAIIRIEEPTKSNGNQRNER